LSQVAIVADLRLPQVGKNGKNWNDLRLPQVGQNLKKWRKMKKLMNKN